MLDKSGFALPGMPSASDLNPREPTRPGLVSGPEDRDVLG